MIIIQTEIQGDRTCRLMLDAFLRLTTNGSTEPNLCLIFLSKTELLHPQRHTLCLPQTFPNHEGPLRNQFSLCEIYSLDFKSLFFKAERPFSTPANFYGWMRLLIPHSLLYSERPSRKRALSAPANMGGGSDFNDTSLPSYR